MSNHRHYPVFFIILAALIPAVVFGTTYKWVDKDGKIHYSDNPPADVDATPVRGAPKPSVDPNKAMEELQGKAKAFNERHEDRRIGTDAKKNAATKSKRDKEICDALAKNLTTLQNNPKIKSTGPDGKEIFFDEEQRQAEIKKTQARIAEEC